MSRLDDKLIVVTGAFGVLGAAVAEAAEAAGARVARVDRASASQAGPRVFGDVDLTDEGEARRVMAEIAGAAGRIDGLVNVAGGFTWRTLKDGSTAVWDQMFRINLVTAVAASAAALDYLTAARGAIVNIGANAAGRAAAGMGAYAAAKSGVLRLTESLAEEVASAGVRVNAVMPSIIDTPTNRRDMPDAKFTTWVLAEDIAEVVVFLLSDEAGVVTGAAIPVTNPRGSA
jgi:NAD(P)-dependent dehydrogenase (short-subunit alcohol dehydrogenase family)